MPSTSATSPKPHPICELPLRGGGGEPVSFERTVHSHGCAGLPPATILNDPLVYRRPFRLDGRIVVADMQARDGCIVVTTPGKIGKRQAARVERDVARMFRLDDDLSRFYELIVNDDRLSWAANGAGRMLSSPTVFEDLVKTICTTNCTWAATIRMTTALADLGGGAFPEPQTLAMARPAWFRDVAKMGYRGDYVKSIARDVDAGALDLERFRAGSGASDEEVEEALLELPGVGPYAAAHVMQLLGRHRHLVLDSWTRPTYLRLSGKRRAADSTIRRDFARYGVYAGLAFWLFLTRGWLD